MTLAAGSGVALFVSADTLYNRSPHVHITLNNTCVYNIQYIVL